MSSAFTGIVPRRSEALLDELMRDEPIVAIHGPRAVGKSTLLRRFAGRHDAEVIDLDDLRVRTAVAANTAASVEGSRPICIDEYMYVPDVLDALKARLNHEGSVPGTAVLTGSTRQDALPRTAQALTGRMHSMTIWPLSQGEISGVHEDLIPHMRSDPEGAVSAHPLSTTTRHEYAAMMCAGGFPTALVRSGASRDRWFDDYIRASLERDALELAEVRQRRLLGDVFRRLCGQTAQVLNVTRIADELQANWRTVEGYVRLLEDLFLVARIPGWGRTLTGRAASRPKTHVVDPGVAARMLRITPAKLGRIDPAVLTEFGHLLESFAVGELRKQLSWLEVAPTIGHWRTKHGEEVDLVVEFDDGDVLAFEVKASERVAGGEFRGLRQLRDTLGERFVAGVALSLGSRSYTYEDRLHVMPLDRLWRSIA